MRECRTVRTRFLDYYYGEVSGEVRGWLENHFKVCARCATEFAEVRDSLDLLRAGKAEPPSSVTLERSWEEIRRGILEPGPGRPEPARARFVLEWWLPRLAFSILLVAFGVWLGWHLRPQSDHSATGPNPGVSPPGYQDPARLWSHLQKSEVLMLEILNFQAAEDDSGELTRELGRRVSEELLEEGELVRSELRSLPDIDEEMLELIRDLELILLQVAHLGEDSDSRELIEAVRAAIREQAIVLRINLAILLSKKTQPPRRTALAFDRNRS